MNQNVAELRKHFEQRLHEFLKKELSPFPGAKFTRRKITITSKESGAIGSIHFEYLSNTHSYETIVFIEHPVLQAEIERIAPPYPSNLSNPRLIYCMSTAGEREGCILLPTTEQGIDIACKHVLGLLKDVQLPLVLNALEMTPAMLDEILANPKYYSYPVPLIFTILSLNKTRPDDGTLARILSEQTLGYTNNQELKNSFHAHLVTAFN